MADGCSRSCKVKDSATKEKEPIDEKELERLAVESILSDAKRGKVRAESFGPSGWQKCLVPRTNKRFLNTLVAEAVSTNKRMKLQQLQREKRRTDTQTDIGDAGVNGRKKAREPRARKDGMISSRHTISERRKRSSPSKTISSIKSSDKEKASDQ